MTNVYRYKNKILLVNKKVAINENCCCDDDPGHVCCNPECGAGFSVDFLPDPGVGEAFSAFLADRGYTNIQYIPEELFGFASWIADCCKTDPFDVESFEVTGQINGFPQSTIINVEKCLVGPTEGTNCVEGLTKEECEERFGTVVAANSCQPDPCAKNCSQMVYDQCPESYTVTFDVEGFLDPACNTTLTYTVTKSVVEAGGQPDRGWQGGEANFVSVTIFCQDGRWILSIGSDNFPFECPAFSSQVIDLGSVGSCPKTGQFTSKANDIPANSPVSVG
jgi:hypothetical protein